jgi:hypothetical protein
VQIKFLKNLIFFKKIIFFVCSRSFWYADIKNNFLKNKKTSFSCISSRKTISKTIATRFLNGLGWEKNLWDFYLLTLIKNISFMTPIYMVIRYRMIFMKKISKKKRFKGIIMLIKMFCWLPNFYFFNEESFWYTFKIFILFISCLHDLYD